MAKIKILEPGMINMIAAGEVVERPASVVKELLENSIDAGATAITVSIEDGGRKLISITDNGGGMDAEDLATAFEPHATSKIATDKDLHTISTLGFRGEALPSIASIAMTKAVSRTADSLSGNSIEIDCGQKSEVKPSSCDIGTTIEVRDIFYKMPARKKFLKTANTESQHIIEVFTRIALANTQLDMRLISNGRQSYNLKAGQSVQQRIGELFSSEIAGNLIETYYDDKKTNLKITALMGKPSISRTNNKLQYIFLNGRFIRDKFISHAIREAYRGCVEDSRYPVIFLFMQMRPEDFDVNVHPTKIEVRFYNSNLVHSQVLACIREKLLSSDTGVDAKLPARQAGSAKINDAIADFFKKYKTEGSQRHIGFSAPSGGEKYSHGGQYKRPDYEVIPEKKKFIQIHDSFLITETADGFSIIDQHALHERIMYENLSARLKAGRLESQKLLIPESFEVTGAQAKAINENAELIENLGIEIVPFGPKTFAIQSFPVILSKVSPADFVRDLIDLLSEKSTGSNNLLDDVVNMAACKAAVKAGQKLNEGEIEQLLADSQKLDTRGRCPHGRPTMINFSKAELEKQFKRT